MEYFHRFRLNMIEEVERQRLIITNLKNELNYNELEFKKEIIKLEGKINIILINKYKQ